jgi:hypothetical protein
MARSDLGSIKACVCGVGLLAVLSSVGCQSDYAGQTLPSPYWLQDDIQYFPPGPEFKLSREAAAMKTYGTGRAAKPGSGPLAPADGAPIPGLLPGDAPLGPPLGAGGPAVGPPAGPPVGVPPADAPPPPVGDEPAEGDPFNP